MLLSSHEEEQKTLALPKMGLHFIFHLDGRSLLVSFQRRQIISCTVQSRVFFQVCKLEQAQKIAKPPSYRIGEANLPIPHWSQFLLGVSSNPPRGFFFVSVEYFQAVSSVSNHHMYSVPNFNKKTDQCRNISHGKCVACAWAWACAGFPVASFSNFSQVYCSMVHCSMGVKYVS